MSRVSLSVLQFLRLLVGQRAGGAKPRQLGRLSNEERSEAMPNCDFYAAPGDYEPILQFIFDSLDCRVLEAYSGFDCDLKEFFSVDELSRKIKLGDCSSKAPARHLVLWPIAASDNVRIQRIDLDPAGKLGAYRYTAEGWGLISLQLGGISPKGLHPSRTNHNTEKRALKWTDVLEDTFGAPSAWDWRIVTRTSNKLNRRIRSLAIASIGSRAVLPEAKKALDAGTPALGI
jgi:hypothetical protein